jgi:hypothetical protein
MMYKEFNLAEAKKDWSHVCFRNGRDYVFGAINPRPGKTNFPIVGWDADGTYRTHTLKGAYLISTGNSEYDLVIKVETITIPERWENIYPPKVTPNSGAISTNFLTREAADRNAANTRIACIHHPAVQVEPKWGIKVMNHEGHTWYRSLVISDVTPMIFNSKAEAGAYIKSSEHIQDCKCSLGTKYEVHPYV